MGLFKKTLTVWVMRLALTILIFLADLVVSRYLGVALKGDFFFLATSILLIGTFLTGGLHLGNIYYYKYIPFLELVANSTVYLGGVAVLLIALGSPLLTYVPVLAAAGWGLKILFLGCLGLECAGIIFINLFVATDKLLEYAQIRIWRRSLFLVLLGVGWFCWQASLQLVLGFYFLAILIIIVIASLTLGARLPWQTGHFRFRLESFEKCLVYGLQSQALVTVDMATQRLNAIFLGFWASSAQNGLYSVAINFGQALWVLVNVLGLVIQSGVNYPREQQIAHLKKLSRHALILMIFPGVILALVADPLIRLGYGAEFAGAGSMLRIMLPGFVIYTLYPLLSSFMIVNGKAGISLLASLSGLLVEVVLSFLSIPRYGGAGAAWSLSWGYLTSTVLLLLLVSYKFSVPIKSLLILQKSDVQNMFMKIKQLYSFRNG